MVILAVVPISAAAHLDANPGSSSALIASLAFLPGLFGAFLWVIDNNAAHHRAQQDLDHPNLPMWQRATGRKRGARRLLNSYKDRMFQHSHLQNWGSVAALLGATAFLTTKALGAWSAAFQPVPIRHAGTQMPGIARDPVRDAPGRSQRGR